MKVLLEISFCGSAYHGWQVQPDAPSVQKTLQLAAEKLLGCKLHVTGCSRTDSGVHAKQYFCTLEGNIGIPLGRLPAALNTLLPEDMAALNAIPVPDDFHARYSCLGKEYRYDIHIGAARDPLTVGRAWQLCRELNIERMQAAAEQLCGTHDFSAFCASGSGVEDKVRTVYDVSIRRGGELVSVFVSADGFLYNMVRIITGTLVDVGLGKKDPADIPEVITNGKRSGAGVTAPACGLYLNRVFYDLEDYRRNNGREDHSC